MIVLNQPQEGRASAGPETITGTISDVFASSKEFGVAPSDGGAVKRYPDQESGHHLCRWRTALARGVGTRATSWKSPRRSIRPRTRSFRRSMPRGPGSLPPGNCDPATMPRGPSSWNGRRTRTHQDLKIFVPADLKKIYLERPADVPGKARHAGQPESGRSLEGPVRLPGVAGNVANRLEALRQVEFQGVLAEDFDGATLSVIKENRQVVKLPFAIAIRDHDQRPAVGQAVESETRRSREGEARHLHRRGRRPADARPAAGSSSRSATSRRRRSAWRRTAGRKMTYLVGPQCKITLGDEAVPLDVLRSGDRVRIEHGAIDPKSQTAISATAIAAERPTDATRWALIIAVQNYDDKRLSPLSYPLADAELLEDVLTKRYRIAGRAVAGLQRPQRRDPGTGSSRSSSRRSAPTAGWSSTTSATPAKMPTGRSSSPPRTSAPISRRSTAGRCNGSSIFSRIARPRRSSCCWTAATPAPGRNRRPSRRRPR